MTSPISLRATRTSTNIRRHRSGSPCEGGQSDAVCLSWGDQGLLHFGPIQGVGNYGNVGQGNQVAVQGIVCSQDWSVEVDQFVYSSGATEAAAVQFDCSDDNDSIVGTIAYNIVPTDPSAGYYLFGQAGELAGFGNDSYLVYLDGASDYNLNAPHRRYGGDP